MFRRGFDCLQARPLLDWVADTSWLDFPGRTRCRQPAACRRRRVTETARAVDRPTRLHCSAWGPPVRGERRPTTLCRLWGYPPDVAAPSRRRADL